MTCGAGATPAWDVPGAWPGYGVPVAVSSVSQQSRFSDFLGGRDSSGVLPAGGAENTNVVGVPPDVGTWFPISGGTGCTDQYIFSSGISACAFDGETNFLVTSLPSCLITLCVASPDATVLAVRGAGLRGGVKFRLTVSSVSGMGLTTCEISVCCKKTLSRECGVSCFVYAMERGTERTTTGFAWGGAVDGCTNGVSVVGSVCMIVTNVVQEGWCRKGSLTFSVSWDDAT